MGKAFLGLFVCALLIGCSASDDIPKGEATIAEFHQKLNAADFDAIYDGSSPDMQKATAKEDFIKFVSAVHRKLGDFQSGKTSGWNDTVATGGHFLMLSYAATYEKGDATENFKFQIKDGKAILTGYQINSNALIVN